jgi:hypothetical protein
LLTQTLDSRPLTLDRREKTEVWCLPARSPSSRSLAEGRRFGEGRSEVDCLKWCLKSEVPPQADLNCRPSLRRLDEQRRNGRNRGSIPPYSPYLIVDFSGKVKIKEAIGRRQWAIVKNRIQESEGYRKKQNSEARIQKVKI